MITYIVVYRMVNSEAILINYVTALNSVTFPRNSCLLFNWTNSAICVA